MERINRFTETSKDSLIRAWIDGQGVTGIRNHHSAQMYKYVLDGEWYETLWRYIGGMYYTGHHKTNQKDPVFSSKVGDYITYDLISTTFLCPQEVLFREDEGAGLADFFHPENGVIRFADTRGLDIRDYADWFDQEEVITCGKFKVTNISMENFYFYDEDTRILDEYGIKWDEDDFGEYFKCKVYDLMYVDDDKEQREALQGLLKYKLDMNRKTSADENGYYASKGLDELNDEGMFET